MARDNRLVINSIIWSCLLIVSLFVFRYFGMTNKQTIVFLFVGVIACILHVKKAKEDDSHLRQIFAINSNSNRIYYYDHLRLIAVLLVIITHSVQVDESKGLYIGATTIFVHKCIYLLALSCNLIYVMISGALLLQWKDEKLSDFYLKRIPRVLFPMIIYYFWYIWQNNEIHEISFFEIIKRFYTGTTLESPHYWLLLIIISLYIIFPFVRYMLKDLPYNYLTVLVVIGILFMAATVLTKEPVYQSVFMADWIGVSIIGYWLSKEETRKYYPILVCIGLISGIVICLTIYYDKEYLAKVTNCSPYMTLFSVGIFSMVLMSKRLFTKGNYILRLISKYSYSIILIHWWCLHWVTIGKLGINTTIGGYLGILISAIVTLMVSLCFAFAIDNFVIDVVMTLWNGLLFLVKSKQK